MKRFSSISSTVGTKIVVTQSKNPLSIRRKIRRKTGPFQDSLPGEITRHCDLVSVAWDPDPSKRGAKNRQGF